jgi:ureidoglycolate lyase
VALGERGTAVDFVVVQFANGVAVEDCQEVFLEEAKLGASAKAGDIRGILVALRPAKQSKGGAGRMVKL